MKLTELPSDVLGIIVRYVDNYPFMARLTKEMQTITDKIKYFDTSSNYKKSIILQQFVEVSSEFHFSDKKTVEYVFDSVIKKARKFKEGISKIKDVSRSEVNKFKVTNLEQIAIVVIKWQKRIDLSKMLYKIAVNAHNAPEATKYLDKIHILDGSFMERTLGMKKWININLNNFDYLTTLNLNNRKLNFLPSMVGKLTKLEELHLMGNKLRNLPPEIENLNELQLLDISNNNLINLPSEIGNLSNLVSLFLDDNFLNFLPTTIGALNHLEELHISCNLLKELPLEIGSLNKLEILSLADNYLSSLPYTIGMLSQLKKLYITENALESLPYQLKNLKNLKELTCDGSIEILFSISEKEDSMEYNPESDPPESLRSKRHKSN